MITKTSELPWVLGSWERCLTEVFAGEWTEYIGAKLKTGHKGKPQVGEYWVDFMVTKDSNGVV